MDEARTIIDIDLLDFYQNSLFRMVDAYRNESPTAAIEELEKFILIHERMIGDIEGGK